MFGRAAHTRRRSAPSSDFSSQIRGVEAYGKTQDHLFYVGEHYWNGVPDAAVAVVSRPINIFPDTSDERLDALELSEYSHAYQQIRAIGADDGASFADHAGDNGLPVGCAGLRVVR